MPRKLTTKEFIKKAKKNMMINMIILKLNIKMLIQKFLLDAKNMMNLNKNLITI